MASRLVMAFECTIGDNNYSYYQSEGGFRDETLVANTPNIRASTGELPATIVSPFGVDFIAPVNQHFHSSDSFYHEEQADQEIDWQNLMGLTPVQDFIDHIPAVE